MTDLDAWHAGHVAFLLQQLDSVPEGSGTLLDHTVVVWVAELATPMHQHWDVCTLLAGGRNGFFNNGYVRYPRTLPNPLLNMAITGPAQTLPARQLAPGRWVKTDTSFGMTSCVADDGTPFSLTEPLTEL
jgi:hypothetical protein